MFLDEDHLKICDHVSHLEKGGFASLRCYLRAREEITGSALALLGTMCLSNVAIMKLMFIRFFKVDAKKRSVTISYNE